MWIAAISMPRILPSESLLKIFSENSLVRRILINKKVKRVFFFQIETGLNEFVRIKNL